MNSPIPEDSTTSDPAESTADSQWLRDKNTAVVETLNGLISAHQIDRAELALKLGWRPARLTRTLSGKERISIQSIAQIVAAIGVDFDLVIRETPVTGPSNDAATPGTSSWQQYLHPAGTFIGMTVGIGILIHLLLQHYAAEAVPPFLGALLGAAVFVLARSHWKLWLARREIRALKRYLKSRSAP